jgi:glycosyltransferase involved in cell wall biosynthesis
VSRLRILVLAPDLHPDSYSTALVGYSHSEALARLHSVTLITRGRNAEAVRRRGAPFYAVKAITLPWLDRINAWSFRWIFKNTYTTQALTAFAYPFALAFEWRAWRQMRTRILAGDFDVVLRLMPITSVLPSPFAHFLRHGPIPFVIGPINGGLPWPQGFSQTAKQREWLSNFRNVYRVLPFARSTYRNAAAIIAGSSQTYAEFSKYREKIFFIPENGVSASLFTDGVRRRPRSERLELIFVGGLVPIKACDLALRAAAAILRRGEARFTIVGDGPERGGLEELTRSLGIEKCVSFRGMVGHAEAMRNMQEADVLVFPSIRDFGGAVVFEAMALGVVPVVVDFGGPGDTVRPEVGYKVRLTSESDVVSQIEGILEDLVRDRDLLQRLRQESTCYARENFTWDRKAQVMTEILTWAVGRGQKPDLRPPKILNSRNC